MTDASDGKRYPLTLTPDDSGLVLRGSLREATIRASLRKVDSSKLRLNSQGFHWVQEYPFNR